MTAEEIFWDPADDLTPMEAYVLFHALVRDRDIEPETLARVWLQTETL